MGTTSIKNSFNQSAPPGVSCTGVRMRYTPAGQVPGGQILEFDLRVDNKVGTVSVTVPHRVDLNDAAAAMAKSITADSIAVEQGVAQ